MEGPLRRSQRQTAESADRRGRDLVHGTGMNAYIKAVVGLDLPTVQEYLSKGPRWRDWAEPSGKNALHYLCGVGPSSDPEKAEASLRILKLLLKNGMDINSIHRIEEKNRNYFPATPLWYAYTRGRNEKLYKYLLKQGADPSHCWWAIAWYDDVAAGKLWLKTRSKARRKAESQRSVPRHLPVEKIQIRRMADRSGSRRQRPRPQRPDRHYACNKT